MEAILAKVLEQFRACFTGKGLNTHCLESCASPGKWQTKVQTQTTQTYWRKVPCSHMLFGCLLFYQFSKTTLRVVRKEAQEQSRVVGNTLVTNGPPTPKPLTLCPVSLLRAGFMTLQLQHLEDLGWKTFRHVLPAQHWRISCRESKPTTSFRISLVLFSKLDGLMNSLIFILMWLEDQCRIICLYTQKKKHFPC